MKRLKVLLNNIRYFWKSRSCIHSYKFREEKVLGATLGWAGEITRVFESTDTCKKCGYKRFRTGYIYPGEFDKWCNPVFYNEQGWPVDESENKLKVWE